MPWLNLDIRTLLVLLVFGNLLAVLLMAFSKGDANAKGAPGRFIAGKTLQAVAWALLSLRGQVPDLLSAYLGNARLISRTDCALTAPRRSSQVIQVSGSPRWVKKAHPSTFNPR